MTPTTEDRARLRALLEKATPGPWRSGRSDMTTLSTDEASPFYKNIYVTDPRGGTHLGHDLPFIVARGQGDEAECLANAALIVAAVNALPALLDECERLERENARLTKPGTGYDPEAGACTYCHGVGACPRCWGRVGIDRLERERDEEKEKREESDRDIAEIEGLRQAAESEVARLRAQRDGLREALASVSLATRDNTAPAHVILESIGKRARAALAALGKGTK